MHCVICKRPLLNPAKTMETKGEPIHWGRGCAIKTGVLIPRPRVPGLVSQAPGGVDPRQMALEMECDSHA